MMEKPENELKILSFYDSEDKDHWLSEIKKCSWAAGKFLYELVTEDRFKELCGQSAKILLLTDGGHLASFCTYAEQDDVRAPEVTPWAGFVYTFPEYRGRHLMGKLLDKAYELAKADGFEYLHISTGETGLYEKYGYTFWKFMKEWNGADSRIYRKRIE